MKSQLMSLFQRIFLYVVKSLHVSGPLAHPQEIHTAVDTTIGSVSVPFWSRGLNVFYLYVVKSLHVSGPLAHPQEIHTAVDTTIGSISVPFWSRALHETRTQFECAVGGLRHPQHTQTCSNSSTIAADSSNGVKNNRCCRYSCMGS